MNTNNSSPAFGGAGERRDEAAERLALQQWAISETDTRGFSNLTVWDIYEHGRQQEREALAATVARLKAENEALRRRALPVGYAAMPVEPTQGILSAMAGSNARDDEGNYPTLLDLLDFSGEEKTRSVLRAAYRAAVEASPFPPSARLPQASGVSGDKIDLLADLYRWLARAKFDNQKDETRAALFGDRIGDALTAPLPPSAPAHPAAVQGWISVKERLPAFDFTANQVSVFVHVIAALFDGSVYAMHYRANGWTEKDANPTWAFADGRQCRSYHVTHWMPLPPAPTQQTGGGNADLD